MKRYVGPALIAAILGALLLLGSPTLAMAIVDVGGWKVTFASNAEDYEQPSVDAGRFVWSDYQTGQGGVIKQYDVASGQVETLLQTDLQPAFPVISGDYVVFEGYDNKGGQSDSGIYLLSLASKQLRKLSAEGWQGRGPLVSGDVIAWTEWQVSDQGLSHTRIVLHRLSTDQTTTITQAGPGTDQVTLSLVSDRWVLWRQYNSQAGKNTVGYSIASGEGRTWEVLKNATLQTIVGDTLYYTLQEGSQWTLHTRNLASGVDVSVVSNDQPIQSVCVDGGRIAWASTSSQGSFVAISDPLRGTSTVIRCPADEVGGLSFKGDLLLWRAGRLFNSPTTPGTHVFVYDASDGTATRVSTIQSYPHGFSTNGNTIAVSESSYRPGYFATSLMFATRSALDKTKLFSDVPGTDPYWTAIEGLREKGAIGGYPGSSGQAEFRPAGALTRSQFAKMLCLALGETESSDYLTTLVKLGVLQGTASGNLNPYGQLTRAQMITMVVRAADRLRPAVLAGPIPSGPSSTLGLFDKTHGLTLRRAEWGGLLDGLVGFDKTWDPWRPASRAETAEVLWNLASVSFSNATDSSPTDPYVPAWTQDAIPSPIVDGAVEGWLRYLGNGQFQVESGHEFFWHDGHFENADGSLMQIPPSAKAHLHDLGIDKQPSADVTYYSAPRLQTTPRAGVTLTVTISQWTEGRLTATVAIRNNSGLPFSFANKDLALYMSGTSVQQTNLQLRPFEVAAGASAEFRTDVYFIVSQFDSAASGILYASSDPESLGFIASAGPTQSGD
jgi:hypothetical protein